MPIPPPVPWGTHVDFVRRYEDYFLATYLGPGGRAKLVTSIGSEVRRRGSRRFLDLAAGTGFPALDLAQASDDLGLEVVHVCDGDRVMIRELIRQANTRQVDPAALNPRLRSTMTPRQEQDDLVINWGDLGVVRDTYDYVLCRGNALAYADTWSGEGEVSSRGKIRGYLAQMAARLDRGGVLHIDAPWKLTPREGPVDVVRSPELVITEEISDHTEYREWLVHFTEIDEKGATFEISFRRLSSPLTIHDVREELGKLGGFEDIQPFQLEAERKVYGTIIARKVR